MFIMFIFDLKVLDILNYLLKYADDCTLLCPESSNTSIELEMANIMLWANNNKLLLNLLKTKEMVFHRPNPRNIVFPAELAGIERVGFFKLLGVQFQPDFRFSEYFTSVITVCNQRLFLLTQLKKQGLGIAETDSVFKSIILSKIIYALPALAGYLTDNNLQQIASVFKKAKRWQLTCTDFDIQAIMETLQLDLFQHSKSPSHCLHHLYTPTLNTSLMVLRGRGHNFHIPTVKYEFTSKSFINRCLAAYR